MKIKANSGQKRTINTGVKKTRQGASPNTKLSATPSRGKQQPYRGQG
jgi:hypothetical protein